MTGCFRGSAYRKAVNMAGTPKEFAMREPVCQWMIDNRYWPELEVGRYGRIADIFGANFGPRPGPRRIPPILDIMAIELKRSDMAGVLRQCREHTRTCERVYAAIPKERFDRLREATKREFETAGVGILIVDGFEVRIGVSCLVRELDRSDEWYSESRRTLEALLWRRARRGFDASGFSTLVEGL